MPPRERRTRHGRAVQRQRARAARRVRRIVGGTVLATAVIVTLLVTAFGSGNTGPIRSTGPAKSARLLPAGPPQLRFVAPCGAAPGTDVYSPVDGTVVGLSPYVLNGKRYGARIELQPTGQPSLVVAVTQLEPDPALAVGSSVSSRTSKLGTVINLTGVEKQAL